MLHTDLLYLIFVEIRKENKEELSIVTQLLSYYLINVWQV